MAEAANMAELLGGLDFDPAELKAKYLSERISGFAMTRTINTLK